MGSNNMLYLPHVFYLNTIGKQSTEDTNQKFYKP